VTVTSRTRWIAVGNAALWLALALPALYQIALLATAIAGRAGYPYDLEWMEGGMLHHAQRIRLGLGIYVAPSTDFIPYLYTPLYPTLLALLSGPFGLSYGLGRALSILALVGIAGTTVASLFAGPERRERPRGATLVGGALALGLFAAAYPFVDGWYDLVRADTLFLFMITAGIAGLPIWARGGDGIAGHGKVAAGAALLALAFFCKQTGIFYVAFGGVIVVIADWRRAPTYAFMAGVIGLGGSWILDHTTNSWFWTYISEIHRAHDFSMDRFRASFGHILWHFPAASVVIAATLVLVAVTAWRRGAPPAARPFVLWTCAYALSTVVGAVGWGTEFAHFNAYMPALLHGAIAAGAAVPAALACARALWGEHRRGELIATSVGVAAALPLAITCGLGRWQPGQFIPTTADVAAGDRLIQRIKNLDGDVWVPSHPWYAALADKPMHVHRMGIKDVTARQPRAIEGLDDQLRHRRFGALVLDSRDIANEVPELAQFYHRALPIPPDEKPRLYSGAGCVSTGDLLLPDAIWLPNEPAAAAAPGPAPSQAHPAR
jgi:hypothetical protein